MIELLIIGAIIFNIVGSYCVIKAVIRAAKGAQDETESKN